MATVIKTCRVCDKEYEMCATARRVDGVFRWQEVACSPDCGEKYLAAVLRGRAGVTVQAESYDTYVDEDEDIDGEDDLIEEDDFEIELL